MKFGIIGAMDTEVECLLAHMSGKETIHRAGMDFNTGTLCGVDVVVVRCGIGKVNAAVCATVLLDSFGVSHVINTGAAGAIAPRVHISDVVIATELVHHDVDVTGLGYQLGEVPQLGTFTFACDPTLTEQAHQACERLPQQISVHKGRVASGDQFVSTNNQKRFIAEHFDALCCEMEGAAIAHACWLHHTPFLVVRAISDSADDAASVSYPEFEAAAGTRSAQMVEALLKQCAG